MSETGGVRERLQAALASSNVVRWWKDCDPEARPVFEEARVALARLAGEPLAAAGEVLHPEPARRSG